MNKIKLFEFLEINKLDRGLFRIWIVLTILWLCSMTYAIIDEKLIHKAREEQNKILTCVETTGGYFQLMDLKTFKKEFFTDFYSYEECLSFVKYNTKNLNNAVIITIGGPILVLFFWFFFKKLFLWLYRGFR